MMHIPFGMNYWERKGHTPAQVFMNETHQTRFLEILDTHKENVVIHVSSHIHRARIQAAFSKYRKNVELVTFISPSISPIYFNNPSFSVMQLDKAKSYEIKEVSSWSF